MCVLMSITILASDSIKSELLPKNAALAACFTVSARLESKNFASNKTIIGLATTDGNIDAFVPLIGTLELKHFMLEASLQSLGANCVSSQLSIPNNGNLNIHA